MRKGLMLAAALMMPLGSVVPMQGAAAEMMPTFSLSQTNGPSIEIMVRHTVEVDPDIAYIFVEVEGKGKTADEAVKALAPKSQKVTKALRPFAQKPSDFETVHSAVGADTTYNRETGEETVVGYVAKTRIKITVRNLDQVAEVIESATANGANQVDEVSFDLENKETAEMMALDEGLARAMARAQKHAKWAGYNDVKVVWITDQIDSRSMASDGMVMKSIAVDVEAEAAAEEVQISIVPGKVSVTTQFVVRFEMVKS